MAVSALSPQSPNPQSLKFLGGCSSVGRAVALQAIGQEFDSPQLHHFKLEQNMGRIRKSFRNDFGPVAQLVRACA